MLGLTVNQEVEAYYTLHNGGSNPFTGRSLYQFTDWDGNTKHLLKVYENMSRAWDDRLYLKPLPTDQLQLNDNLTQNPGWE